MILLLTPKGHALRNLLPEALAQASLSIPIRALDPGPESDHQFDVELHTEGLEIQGQLEIDGEPWPWHELRGAWSVFSPPAPTGSPLELLLQGLDLAPIPVVGRPSVREAQASARRLDASARAAGLARPPRAWTDPGGGQHLVASASTLEDLWCGSREIHGASPELRPWVAHIQAMVAELGMIWGRIQVEVRQDGPPCVHAVTSDTLLPASVAQLTPSQRQALLALVERFQRGHLHALPGEQP